MKELFASHYAEYVDPGAEFCKTCHVPFDANALLNVFRYNEETLSTFFNIMEKLGERVWLPYYAAVEYHRGIENRVQEQHQRVEKLLPALTKLRKQLKKEGHHPYFNFAEASEALGEGISKIQEIEKRCGKARTSYAQRCKETRNRLADLFSNRVGSFLTVEQLEARLGLAQSRFAFGIGPGHKDGDKIVNSAGDVVIWCELKDYARGEKCQKLLFVTDDAKTDWRAKRGRPAPHPELLNEMRLEANCDLRLLFSDTFLTEGMKFLNLSLPDEQVTRVANDAKRARNYSPVDILRDSEKFGSTYSNAMKNSAQFLAILKAMENSPSLQLIKSMNRYQGVFGLPSQFVATADGEETSKPDDDDLPELIELPDDEE